MMYVTTADPGRIQEVSAVPYKSASNPVAR